MAVQDLLNKAIAKERLSPDEHEELKSWVARRPEILPSVNKVLRGERPEPEEVNSIQSWINESSKEDALRTQATSVPKASIADKALDLVGGFGKASVAAQQGIKHGLGFIGDIAAQTAMGAASHLGMVPENTKLPSDFRQQVEEGVGYAASLGKALVTLGENPHADLVRRNDDFTPEEKTAFYENMRSPEIKAMEAQNQALGKKAFEGAGGGVLGALAQVKAQGLNTIASPGLTANLVSSQLPNAAAMMATGGLTGSAGAAVGVGAVMQGSDVAGQVHDDLMGLPPETWEQFKEYNDRVKLGEPADQVKQDIANRQARLAFVPSAAASAALNSTGFGGLTERALAGAASKVGMAGGAKLAGEGVAKTLLRGLGKQAGETILSEVPEEGFGAVFGGLAKRPVSGEDPFKDVGDNVSAAMIGLGPISTITGTQEAFHERAAARKEAGIGATPSPAPAGPTAPQSPTTPVAPVAPTTPFVNTEPAMAPIGSTESSQRTANLEAKRKDLDEGFKDLLAANPAMGDEASKWRSANPMGEAVDFENHFKAVKDNTASEMAAQHPNVVEAQAQATQVQAQAQAAQQIASGEADPSLAPPAGLSIEEAQSALKDGGQALAAKAKAAEENVRTVQQTVEKEIKASEPVAPTEGVLKKKAQSAKQIFGSYRTAVEAGAVEMDAQKYTDLATAAGIPEAAIATHSAVTMQKIAQREQKASEKTAKESAKAPEKFALPKELSKASPNMARDAEAGAVLSIPSNQLEQVQALAEVPDAKNISDLMETFNKGGKEASQVHFDRIIQEQNIPIERAKSLVHQFKLARESPSTTVAVTPKAKSTYGEANKLVSKSAKDDIVARMKAKAEAQRSTLSSTPGMDPELLTMGAQLAAFHIEAGTRKFIEVVKAVASDLGDSARSLRKYLGFWYNGARDLMEIEGMDISGMDSREEVSRQMAEMMSAKPAATSVGTGKHAPLVKAFDSLGELPTDNNGVKKALTEIDGQVPDLLRMKDGQEALETIVGMRARDRVASMRAEGASKADTFLAMREIYQSQPNLNIRTSTSLENQAYSTPVPLSYLAGELAVVEGSTVYEPAAGNGLLLIGADPGKVWANELDSRRFENMRGLGYANIRNGLAQDAISDGFVAQKSVQTVLANPPFGKVLVDGKPGYIEYDSFRFTKLDHLIAAQSLLAMKDDGRATLIVGGSKDPLSSIDKLFLGWLYKRYNVIGHFQVAGDLYSRQGAAWPVRVLVINGRGKSSLSHLIEAKTATKWSEVLEYGQEILGSEAFGQREPNGPGDVSKQPSNRGGRGSGSSGGKAARPNLPGSKAGDGSGEAGSQPVAGPVTDGRLDGGSVAPDLGGPIVSEPVGLEPDGTVATSSGSTGEFGEPVALDGARSSVDAGIDLDSLVQPYTPKGYQTELDAGLFVPTNLLDPMTQGEAFLREKVGDVVQYAATELGYTVDELKDALMGAQTESVAAMIYNMKNGTGTIVADNTGIGKGRQAYMAIRWAIRNGMIPVFVSEKQALFSAMYQDGLDCGDNGFTKPFLLNADASIEVDRGDGRVEVLPKHKYGKEGRKAGMAAIGESGKLPDGYNAIFTTYTQFNQANIQRAMVTKLAPNSILILDESHKAAGEESGTGEFFRNVMKDFKGVTYFSATWAKRPGNMTAYTKTAIGDIGMTDDELTLAISEGGYPLQSIIASSLATQSQFFRRERSFEGIELETVVLPDVDGRHADIHDELTSNLRLILDADNAFGAWFENTYMPQLIQAGAVGLGHVTQDSIITRSPFASTVHNDVRQIALALKADDCARLAIESIQKGEAPVIAVDSTMGTFIAEFVRSEGLKPGDTMTNFGWNAILKRRLDRTLYYNMKDENNKPVRVEIPRSHLPTNIESMYRAAELSIEDIQIDAPASPLDWVRHKVQEAGYSIDEITGGTRDFRVDYSGIFPVLRKVSDTKKQHEKIRRDFNSRKLDAIMINKAGFTGSSMHSDRRWTTPGQWGAKRHFIGWQMALDINDVKQAFGRVDRTGQIVPPHYTIMSLVLPSEKRPIASLQRKFKSLNTSTSSNTKGSMDVEGVDLFNKYGDDIVHQFLAENPAMADRLGISLSEPEPGKAGSIEYGMAEKATGRLAILPVSEQKFFYDQVIPRYNEHIDYLTRSGQNNLLTRIIDLDAREIKRTTIYPGTGNNGPFSGPAHLLEMSCKPTGRILNAEEVQAEIDGVLQGQSPEENRLAMLAEAAESWKTFLGNATPEAIEKAGKAKRDTAHNLPQVGTNWSINIIGDEVSAVVTQVRWDGSVGGNPYSASKWKIRLATNAEYQHVSIPLSRFLIDAESSIELDLPSVFVQDQGSRSVKRIIVGNILGAYTQLNKSGEITSFTDDKGQVIKGMVLPKSFNIQSDIKSQVKIQGGENITGVMKKLNGSIDPFMTSEDGEAFVFIRNGFANIELVSGARAIVTKWSALTGLEFANKVATVEIGPKSVAAFSKVNVNVERNILEDVGVIKEGVVKPESFNDPVQLFNSFSEQAIHSAVDIINNGTGNFYSETSQDNVFSLQRLKRNASTMGDLTRELLTMYDGLKDGSADMKQMKLLFNRIKTMSIRGVNPKMKASARAIDAARTTLEDASKLSRLVMRASMYQKIAGKRAKTGISTAESYKWQKNVSELFPYSNGQDHLALVEYCLFCYNNKHPEEQITSLAHKSEQIRFSEYMSGQKKLHANPWATMAATGAAMMVGAAGISAVTGAAPYALAAAVTVGALYGAKLLLKWVNGIKIRPKLTPVGKIMSVKNTSGLEGVIVEKADQCYLRNIEVQAKADVYLERIKQAVYKASIKSVLGTGENAVKAFIQRNIYTDPSVREKVEEFSKAIPNFLEGKSDLPPELSHLKDAILSLRDYFASHLEALGSKTIEDHFHRMYDFEGLRSLKLDEAALDRLVESLIPEVMQNAYEEIEGYATKHGIPEVREAARAYALALLSDMYDGSEEAKKGKAKAFSANMDEFAHNLMMDKFGEVNTKFYYMIRESLRNKVNPYTAAGMKKRKVPFQLPESWTLSNGEEVKLIERNYFTVQSHYNRTMSLSIAQKEVLNTTMISKFLNSIGPNDNKTDAGRSRIDMERLLTDYHNHRHPGEGFSKETFNDAFNAKIPLIGHMSVNSVTGDIKTANSILYLGLSIAFPLRNMMFGFPKAWFLLGSKAMARATMDLVMAASGARGEKYQQAREAGAIFEKIGDSVIDGTSNRAVRAATFAMSHTQQAVDMAGFFGGIYYAPTCAQKAKNGNVDAMHYMVGAFGLDLAQKILDRPTLGMTQSELDRFGLFYRNMISGTARNWVIPDFLGGDKMRFIMQFASIPFEDTRFVANRVLGHEGEWRYHVGATMIGFFNMGIVALLAKMFKSDEPDEDPESNMVQIVLRAYAKGGGMVNFEPLIMALASDEKFVPERFALKLMGGGMAPVQAGKLIAAVGEARRNLGDASLSHPVEAAVGASAPFARMLINESPLMRQTDMKMDPLTEPEQNLRSSEE